MADPAPAPTDFAAPASAEGLMGFTDAPAAGGYAPPIDASFDAPLETPAPVMQSPGGMAAFGGANDPFSGVPVKDDSYGMNMGSSIPEPTALREWEEKHERELEETMRKEEADKKEKRASATKEIDQWYAEHKGNIEKKKSANRVEEEMLEKARAEAMLPGANPWERIVTLIDTNAQAGVEGVKDTARMRSLLISLKNNPPASAA